MFYSFMCVIMLESNFYAVGIELQFTRAFYYVNENNGPAQPVLTLSQPVDCCSTISVYVNVQHGTAKGM